METSLADFYYQEITKSDNPIPVLVNFYRSLFNLTSVDGVTYKIFGNLARIYGVQLLYLALLDCTDVENIDPINISRLLAYFCKKRLAEKYKFDTPRNLDSLIDKIEKELTRKKRLKIPTPFD